MKKYATVSFPKQTPKELPPTMINLGEKFGLSLTLDGARRVQTIEVRGFRSKFEGDKRIKPHYWVDVESNEPSGAVKTHRSRRTNLTAKQARDLHRSVTRKIAEFLFLNKDVNLIAPLENKKTTV